MSERSISIVDQEIISRSGEALQEVYTARESHIAKEQTAEVRLREANAALEAAQKAATAAKEESQTLGHADQSIDRDIAYAASKVAVEIVRDTSLDPLTRTIHALVLKDESIARRKSVDNYGSAAYKARQAIDAIFERTQPGVPIIELGSTFQSDPDISIYAGVATEHTFTVNPPELEEVYYTRSDTYAQLKGGSVKLVLPDAGIARSKDQGLAKLVTPEDHEIELISTHWEHGYEYLERIAENKDRVVIGEKEIISRIERLDQSYRVAAMLALHASGFRLDVPEPIINNLQGTLIAGLSMVASGRKPHKTEHRHAQIAPPIRANAQYRGGRAAKYAETDSLHVVMKSLNQPTITSLLALAQLDKNTLKDRMAQVLETSTKKKEMSIDQLAENSRAIAGLEMFVDSLFEESVNETV